MLRSDLVPLITAVELSGYKKSADRKMVKNITALERFGPKKLPWICMSLETKGKL
jgi:hypothetical protein